MIVTRDKTIKTLTKCEPFINVISDDNAIAFEKHKEEYKQSSDQIKNGLTKQNGQYYFFEHDIINTPRSYTSRWYDSCFAYKVYPITNDIAERIIKKEAVSKWEILFNAFFNYQKVYTMIKDYELRMNYISSYMVNSKLVIPYGISPSDMGDEETTAESYLAKHARRYGNGEPLKINLSVLRELRFNELNIE
jgi:hypothetical protein